MKITIDSSAGFCFGVRRALTLALNAAVSSKNIVMLGDIVHNEDVVRSINRAGIKKINRLGRGKGKTLLIRAHGASLNTLRDARRHGYTILDATCPMVKEIHAIAKKMEKQGYTLVIIGDKNHDEIKGIKGQLLVSPLVIEAPGKIHWKQLKGTRKVAIVAQSTQTEENVSSIVGLLKKKIKNVAFFNTICLPTRLKQEKMKALPAKNDLMLVIGSKTSANTRRLYELSRKFNPATFWVQSHRDIKQEWFKGKKKVGITAGASTPQETIEAVVRQVSSFETNS